MTLQPTLNVVENTASGRKAHRRGDHGPPTRTKTTPSPTRWTTGDGAAYDIDTSTGQIKTKDPLDRETKASYYRHGVTATDSKGCRRQCRLTSLMTPITVTITVDNEVEPPTFNDGDSRKARAASPERSPKTPPAGQACRRPRRRPTTTMATPLRIRWTTRY